MKNEIEIDINFIKEEDHDIKNMQRCYENKSQTPLSLQNIDLQKTLDLIKEWSQNLNPEPILEEDSNRFTVLPIKHKDIWEAYMTHKKAIWFADEIDLTSDLKDWKNLLPKEQHFIKYVLAFFAASDGIVMENLASRFMSEVQYSEARQFYSVQNFMESEHSLTYSRLIDTYLEDSDERNKLFEAINHFPSITKKADWAMRWIGSDVPFAIRMIAFAAVEGIFFSGSFCCIYWLRERGIMSGLSLSNDFISRDEGLHTDFCVILYKNHIINKAPEEIIHHIFKNAVEIEKEFILEALPCSLLGMNSKLMSYYIEFVANRLLKQLGYNPLYPDAKQPFSFMDRICLSTKTNFFESRESNYQKNVKDDTNKEKNKSNEEFGFDYDF